MVQLIICVTYFSMYECLINDGVRVSIAYSTSPQKVCEDEEEHLDTIQLYLHSLSLKVNHKHYKH